MRQLFELVRSLLRRLTSLFRRRRLEDDLNEELRSHLEMAIEINVRKGMSGEEARREALRSFGGVEQTKERYRDQRGLPVIETTLQDLRYGLRMLRRSPGFSALAILCLTLGIGANAAVFSWIEGVLLRPYPLVEHQERMLAVSGTERGTAGYDVVSWPDFLDFQKSCTLIDAFIAEKISGASLSIGDRAEWASGSVVSANYFEALGVHPMLGRGFEPAENSGRNGHPVVVISYQMWQGRFHGDPEIIGKTQMFNNVRYSIVGVAPKGFYGTFVGYAFQFWVPVSMQETFDSTGYKLEDRGARWIEGFVKLKPGVTREQAQQEISAVAQRLEATYPETNRGRGIKLFPLYQTPFNNAGALAPTLGIALAVVVFVLLIACANVSNLLLVRSFARRHEMTVRLAIGAGPGRVIRQLFTESLILSAFAAVSGLLVAYWCRNLLVRLIPWRGVPMYLGGQLDWRVFALSAGVCVLATLFFALVPALQSGKVDLASALKADSAGVVGSRRKAWIRSTLVVVQVSLSFLLLVGAGLVIQSLQAIRSASPGFSTDNVLVSAVNLFAAGYDVPRARNFQEQLMERVRAVPGVESAAYSRIIPFSYRTYSSAPIAVDGYEPPRDEQPTVSYDEVSPEYLATVGIPLVSGREFRRADDESAPPVAIVNEEMVARFWRGGNPVGSRLQVKGKWMEVVGVAKVAKYGNFMEKRKPFFYVPLRQNPTALVGLNIRTSQPVQTMANALAQEVHALDPDLALYEVNTMREQVDRSTSAQRIAVMLLGVFGGLAVLLAAVGLYGVMSYSVSQSTRELGLRMALGASGADVLRLVMSQGMVLTAGGVLLGAAAALGTTRLLGYLLYNVGPRDPLAFGAAFAVMAVASFAACFFPAWRATRTDPVRALRD
ncbi:MAG TPA: ABC transporter permease [Candidatus Dormibacteraeota bacterium]|nr:ABC transporter permease [Candidatus Dormibacteraeota bacterium]